MMHLRAAVAAEVAASAVAAACMLAAREGIMAAAVAMQDVCTPHIPSQAAPVVRDMDTPVVRATRSQAEGIIADTAGQQWEPQRLVPRPMALMVLTTTVTMRTATGSVPISISIEMGRAHTDSWLALVRCGARRRDGEHGRQRLLRNNAMALMA